MKILVDQAELMKAFDIISDCRNNLPGNGWVKGQLQIACNIIGPMWADGVDENKVLVKRELFKDLLHELDYNQECGVRNVKLVVKRILEENPDSDFTFPVYHSCPICGQTIYLTDPHKCNGPYKR